MLVCKILEHVHIFWLDKLFKIACLLACIFLVKRSCGARTHVSSTWRLNHPCLEQYVVQLVVSLQYRYCVLSKKIAISAKLCLTMREQIEVLSFPSSNLATMTFSKDGEWIGWLFHQSNLTNHDHFMDHPFFFYLHLSACLSSFPCKLAFGEIVWVVHSWGMNRDEYKSEKTYLTIKTEPIRSVCLVFGSCRLKNRIIK